MAPVSPLEPGSPPPRPTDANGPTHYAPAGRATPGELRNELSYLSEDPVIDVLLRSVTGLVAVLNEQRQVLALNLRMLELLGVGDATKVLGLRLGEAVGCSHAEAAPGGCGTSEYCSTCGAAIAIMTSLVSDLPTERICAVELEQPRAGADHLYFRAQVCPLRRGPHRVLLVFIQDVTDEQRRALLERTFFHDVNNTLSAMLTAGELLAGAGRDGDPTLATNLVRITQQLAREIDLQRCLSTSRIDQFARQPTRVPLGRFLDEVIRTCEHHPAATARRLLLAPLPTPPPVLETDETLLLRIVQNMVINALEATAEHGYVRLWCSASPGAVEIGVWNDGAIPPEVARRIFQRNFSTKGTLGRGLGTYAMKLLGERLLGGAVRFTSEAADGTRFRLTLPAPGPAQRRGADGS